MAEFPKYICFRVVPKAKGLKADIERVEPEEVAEDLRPVVRGRWIVHMSELFPADSTIECDQCHELQTAFISDSFCPNCGADMRGGDAE